MRFSSIIYGRQEAQRGDTTDRFYKTEAEQTKQPNRTEQQVSSKLIFSECGNRNHSDRTQFTHVHRPRALIRPLSQPTPPLPPPYPHPHHPPSYPTHQHHPPPTPT